MPVLPLWVFVACSRVNFALSFIYIHIYIHTHIYIERERQTEGDREECVPKMLEQTSGESSFTKTMKVHINICQQTSSFRGPAPTFAWPQSFVFLPLTTFKTSSVFSFNWKWTDTSPTHFWCVSNHSPPHPDLWNGATVHDQTCPCVHWFRWNIFEHLLWTATWYIMWTQHLFNLERVYCKRIV